MWHTPSRRPLKPVPRWPRQSYRLMTSLHPALPALPAHQRWFGSASGHAWTIWSHLDRSLRRTAGSLRAAERLTTWVADPYFGRVALEAELYRPTSTQGKGERESERESELLILVHGLGGSSLSGYMRAGVQAGLDAGMATLCLNLRGADEGGHDFYHAGLTADLRAVIDNPELQSFSHVYVLGFSLGGHVTLRAALEPMPARVRSVAAICPPLDLAASARAFDRIGLWIYRRHVLSGLKVMYRRFRELKPSPEQPRLDELAKRLPTLEEAWRITSLQVWDERIVAPRHGFPSRQHYYTSQSVGPHLCSSTLPSLVVTTRWDPMVPWNTTAAYLQCQGASETQLVYGAARLPLYALAPNVQHGQLLTGGHVAFPASRVDAAQSTTLLHAVVQWLVRHRATSSGRPASDAEAFIPKS